MNDLQTVQKTEAALLAENRRQALLCPGDSVVAACSGGADSMALVLFLLRQREALGIRLSVAHVDHGIRGAAAHADAAFVRDFCRQHGLEFLLYDAAAEGVTVPPNAGEDWARQLRYGWFDMLAQQRGAKIATAHTLTDQAETLLFRLARGTGLHGMVGIPVRRGPYIRPLLPLERAQTEAYCAALGQSYVQDATNAEPIYARNRIRRQVLPALCTVNPGTVQALGRFARQARTLDDWLQTQAQTLLATAQTAGGWALEPLRTAPEPVLTAALRQQLQTCCQPTEKQIQLLLELVQAGQGSAQLALAVCACADGQTLSFRSNRTPVPKAEPLPPQPALPGEYTLPGGYRLKIELWPSEKYEIFIKNAGIFKKGLTCCADYDTINRNVFLRTRQPGDRFHPARRNGHKTLKKYFNEQSVPTERRALLPLLAADHEVLWLWGSGFAEGLDPGPDTRRVLAVTQLPDDWEEEHIHVNDGP